MTFGKVVIREEGVAPKLPLNGILFLSDAEICRDWSWQESTQGLVNNELSNDPFLTCFVYRSYR